MTVLLSAIFTMQKGPREQSSHTQKAIFTAFLTSIISLCLLLLGVRYVCMCSTQASLPQPWRGSQKTTLWSPFSPPTFKQVPETEAGSSSLHSDFIHEAISPGLIDIILHFSLLSLRVQTFSSYTGHVSPGS